MLPSVCFRCQKFPRDILPPWPFFSFDAFIAHVNWLEDELLPTLPSAQRQHRQVKNVITFCRRLEDKIIADGDRNQRRLLAPYKGAHDVWSPLIWHRRPGRSYRKTPVQADARPARGAPAIAADD